MTQTDEYNKKEIDSDIGKKQLSVEERDKIGIRD